MCEDSRLFSTYFTCDLVESEVDVEWNSQPMQVPGHLQKRILRHWDALPKDYIFNGRLARLDSWRLTATHCRLALRPTDYRTLLYSNAYVADIHKEWGPHYVSRALGISAVLVSGSDELVFMKRSAAVGEYPECFDVFGGHIDVPPDNSAPHVFLSMAQELQEEVQLDRSDYDLKLIGLIESTPNQKPELVFVAKTTLTTQQIVSRTKKAQDQIEFSHVHVIGNNSNAIYNFLKAKRHEFSPSAFGSFCVYMSALTK